MYSSVMAAAAASPTRQSTVEILSNARKDIGSVRDVRGVDQSRRLSAMISCSSCALVQTRAPALGYVNQAQ